MADMTRKERMLAALRGRPTDRTPFATYNLHPYRTSSQAGDPSYRELLALVTAKAGMLCKCSVPDRADRGDQAVQHTVAVRGEGASEVTTTRLTLPTPKGDLTSVVTAPRGHPAMVTEPFIKADADIDRYMSLPFRPPRYDITDAAALHAELGDRGLVYIAYSDPMYAAGALFGFEDFILRCAAEPGPVLRLVEHLFERIETETRSLLEACRGYDFLFYTAGPEIATPPMMSPATFRVFVRPYQTRLIECIHAAGQLAVIHCHGRVRAVLDDIIATGVDALEPIEPPDQGDIGLADLLARAGDRLTLMGYIQDQEFYTAPPGWMTRRVEEAIALVNRRGRYIMTPTCTPFQHPASAAYQRNYTEWLEAADRAFGPT